MSVANWTSGLKTEDLEHAMRCEGGDGEVWYLLTKPLKYKQPSEAATEAFRFIGETRERMHHITGIAASVLSVGDFVSVVGLDKEFSKPWYMISPRRLFLRSRAANGLKPALAKKVADLLDEMVMKAFLDG